MEMRSDANESSRSSIERFRAGVFGCERGTGTSPTIPRRTAGLSRQAERLVTAGSVFASYTAGNSRQEGGGGASSSDAESGFRSGGSQSIHMPRRTALFTRRL